MTINIALATSDALVLGCDSVASAREYFLRPFGTGLQRDSKGELLQDGDGNFTMKFNFTDLSSVVTNAWGGVTKMFQIHEQPATLVAITAGTAKLNDRPTASYAADFLSLADNKDLRRARTLLMPSVSLCARRNDQHYEGADLPENLRDGPEFLVGGYGDKDDFPSIYRIRTQENDVEKEFGINGSMGLSGVSWNGQSDAVERFMRGYDGHLRADIENKTRQELQKASENSANTFSEFINDLLAKLGQKLPEGTKFDLPEMKASTIDWDQYAVGLDYANLPLQEAVNFVGFLVMLQAGKARFARGVATVGGYVHVGVITLKDGFTPLEEPKLVHRLRGFTDDF